MHIVAYDAPGLIDINLEDKCWVGYASETKANLYFKCESYIFVNDAELLMDKGHFPASQSTILVNNPW